jgi:hypothetical protein
MKTAKKLTPKRKSKTVPLFQAVNPSRPKRAPPQIRNSFVARVRATFQKGNRLAAAAGTVGGSAIPLGVFSIVHTLPEGLMQRVGLLSVATGGLVFSARSVYDMGMSFFQARSKALGFVVLMEGVMSLAQLLRVSWVAWSASIFALTVLMAANGVSTAVNLVSEDRRSRHEK